MGSFLGQAFLVDHSAKLAGGALCGSAALDHLAPLMGNPDGLAGLNAPFAPGRTGFEWLSRDEAEVDLYVADPLCGFSLNPASTMTLGALAPRLADVAQLKAIRPGFPVYVLAGSEDPVVGRGALVAPLIQRYIDAGLDVTARFYAGARHELLNETNREEVVRDLREWIDRLPLAALK